MTTAIRSAADIAEVEGIQFWGNDLSVDDVVLSGQRLNQTYQVVPGAALNGVLGAYGFTETYAETKSYYQYNDLGTAVVATYGSGNLRSAVRALEHVGHQRRTRRFERWGAQRDQEQQAQQHRQGHARDGHESIPDSARSPG